MKRSRRLLFQLSLLILLFAVAPGLVSTGRATEKKESNPAEERIGEVFKWINFAIVAGAIGYLCVKKAPGFFRGRADQIAAAITEATAAKAAAGRQVQDAEARLARLDQEVAGLRAAAQREAAAEGERIRAATAKEAEKIAAAARAEIEAAARAARLELKALAAKLAVEGAESLLVRQLTPQTQESLVRAFVQKLAQEGRPN